MNTDGGNSVAYARRLYDDIRRWYDNADSKAQVVLAIDGAFLAFLTGSMFAKPTDLRAVVGSFSDWTWPLLLLMTLCLMGSLMSAIWCLWSRTWSKSELMKYVGDAQEEKPDADDYAPKVMWFFQMITVLDKDRFRTTLDAVNDPFELEAMASQIPILSKHVRSKHRYVNYGFALAALTVILFFFAALSYLFNNW